MLDEIDSPKKKTWTQRRLEREIPLPRLWGDPVQEVKIQLEAMADFRSPNDTRRHLELKISKTTEHIRQQFWYGVARWMKIYDKKRPEERKARGHRLGLDDFDQDLMWALVDHWCERGTGKGTGKRKGSGNVANCLAHLRALLRARGLNVDTIVPTNAEILARMGLTARRHEKKPNRALEHFGIEFKELFERTWKVDRVVAVVFLLCWAFGFRLEEAYKWRAREDIVFGIEKALISLKRGMKGGREREFVIAMGEWERKAVFFAKMLSSRGTGGLIPDDVEAEDQFRNRVYAVAKKVGLTKKSLGATPHSLRHSFAQRRFVMRLIEVLGYLPDDGVVPYDVDDAIAVEVAEELGHGRPGVTRIYAGPRGRPYCLDQVRRVDALPRVALPD